MAAQTIKKIFRFYLDGFRSMTVGKTLWAIILVKLFILFAILKVFFFPDFLAGQSPEERSRSVMKELPPTNNHRLCYLIIYKQSTGRVRNSP